MDTIFDYVRGLPSHPLVGACVAYDQNLRLISHRQHGTDGPTHILTRDLYQNWLSECRKAIPTAMTADECHSLKIFFPEETSEMWALLEQWIEVSATVDEIRYPWDEIKQAQLTNKLDREIATAKFQKAYDRLKVIVINTKMAEAAYKLVRNTDGSGFYMSAWFKELREVWDAFALAEAEKLTRAVHVYELLHHKMPGNEEYGIHQFISTSRPLIWERFVMLWIEEATKIISNSKTARDHLVIAPELPRAKHEKTRLEKLCQ